MHMKKIIALLLAATLLFAFAACGKKEQPTTSNPQTTTKNQETSQTTTKKENTENKTDYSKIPDTMSTEDSKYEIAFITDIGQLLDKSFNQGTWEGLKKYAYENGKSYKYYQPANGNQATDTDRYNAMKAAADAGAKVIVCAGYLQEESLRRAATDYPEVYFIFIDGNVIKAGEGEGAQPLKNVAAVDFNEEQSGFLAGYAAVMDGYTRLGFTGGGAGTNPSCNRFAYGYAQGIEQAAKKLGKEVELTLSWEYGASFSPSAELQTMLGGWYAKGTEIIFCCGGPMCQSAFAAASANDGAVIGCDVDQSGESDTVITSALKGLRESVEFTLKKVYEDKWEDIGGKLTTLGAKENAVGLPTDTWKMKSFSVEDYKKLFEAMKKGEIEIDRDYEKLKPESFERLKLVIV